MKESMSRIEQKLDTAISNSVMASATVKLYKQVSHKATMNSTIEMCRQEVPASSSITSKLTP
jgi:hypothetical protein